MTAFRDLPFEIQFAQFALFGYRLPAVVFFPVTAMISEHAHCALALCRNPGSWFCERCNVLWCDNHSSSGTCIICYEFLENPLMDPEWTVLCADCNHIVKGCQCERPVEEHSPLPPDERSPMPSPGPVRIIPLQTKDAPSEPQPEPTEPQP